MSADALTCVSTLITQQYLCRCINYAERMFWWLIGVMTFLCRFIRWRICTIKQFSIVPKHAKIVIVLSVCKNVWFLVEWNIKTNLNTIFIRNRIQVRIWFWVCVKSYHDKNRVTMQYTRYYKYNVCTTLK